MTLISRNVYIDKVEDIVNKYNNTYSTIIKMKRVDVKPNDVKNIYINCSEGLYDNDPKFKIGDVLQYQNTKNFFAKGCVSNWPGEVFIITKVKNTVSSTYLISDPNEEQIFRTFYEKELQKDKTERI